MLSGSVSQNKQTCIKIILTILKATYKAFVYCIYLLLKAAYATCSDLCRQLVYMIAEVLYSGG